MNSKVNLEVVALRVREAIRRPDIRVESILDELSDVARLEEPTNFVEKLTAAEIAHYFDTGVNDDAWRFENTRYLWKAILEKRGDLVENILTLKKRLQESQNGANQSLREILETPWLKINTYIGPTKIKKKVIEAVINEESLLLLGDPGNGKSHLARGMGELLAIFKEPSLTDVLVEPNPELGNENYPKITVVPANSARTYIQEKKIQEREKRYPRARKVAWVWGFVMLPAVLYSWGIVFASVAFLYAVLGGFLPEGFFGLQWSEGSLLSGMGTFGSLVSALLATVLAWGPYAFFAGRWPFSRFISTQTPAIIVDNRDQELPPVIEVTGANTSELLGSVRHDPYQSGGLATPPHLRVEAGAIHRAHLGVLLVDEIRSMDQKILDYLLTAWEDGEWGIRNVSSGGSSGSIESVRTDPIPCKFRLVIATNKLEGILANAAFQSRLTEKSTQILMPNEWNAEPGNLRKYVNFPLHVYETDIERIIRDIHARQNYTDTGDHNRVDDTERNRLILLLDNAITFGEIAVERLLDISDIEPIEKETLRKKGYKEILVAIIDKIMVQECTSSAREQQVLAVIQQVMYLPWTRKAIIEFVEHLKHVASKEGHISLQLREAKGIVRAARDIVFLRNLYLGEPIDSVTEMHVQLAIKKRQSAREKEILDYKDRVTKYENIFKRGYALGRINGLAVIPDIKKGFVTPILAQALPAEGVNGKISYIGRLANADGFNKTFMELSIDQVFGNVRRIYGKLDRDVEIQFYEFKEANEGDSATLPLAVAALSVLYNALVDQTVAMTASMNIQGELKAVGGLKWKIEAAIREGLRKVVISKENLQDIDPTDYEGKIEIAVEQYAEDAILHAIPDLFDREGNQDLRDRLQELCRERERNLAYLQLKSDKALLVD
ncbi:MAG: S16 family serine protease [Candidatus Hodarchaeota archaeon]